MIAQQVPESILLRVSVRCCSLSGLLNGVSYQYMAPAGASDALYPNH